MQECIQQKTKPFIIIGPYHRFESLITEEQFKDFVQAMEEGLMNEETIICCFNYADGQEDNLIIPFNLLGKVMIYYGKTPTSLKSG